MHCIELMYPGWRDAVIHESSPIERGASPRLRRQAGGYIPSQFFPGVPPGSFEHGVRCEDLEDLSFGDETVDLHITGDVLEHVYRPDRVFREIARTLKPGGMHIFTTPLVNGDRPSQIAASRGEDGRINHLLPPDYHGDPVSGDESGALVTFRWGYDICDIVYRTSGLCTRLVVIDDLDLGIRGELNEVLVTVKPRTNEMILDAARAT
jgi:SAM-dependent methyltransferase